jgi:hypothetical protein
MAGLFRGAGKGRRVDPVSHPTPLAIILESEAIDDPAHAARFPFATAFKPSVKKQMTGSKGNLVQTKL